MIAGRPFHSWRLSSLRWRLSAAISGVALLCTTLCVAAAVLFLYSALNDRARAESQTTMTGVSGYLDNQHTDLLGMARLIAADPAVYRAVLDGNQQALVIHLNPFYAGLNVDVVDVIDARGTVLVRMEDTETSGDSLLALSSVRRALTGQEVVALGQDLPGREAAGGYALRATVPIRSGAFRTSGGGAPVVGAVVVGRQFDSTFAARIGHALDAQVNLIAGNQRTGTTITDNNGLPATGLPEPSSVLARIATGKTSIASIQEDGHASLSGVVPLQDADGRWAGAIEVVQRLDPLYDLITRLSLLLLALGAIVVVVGTALSLGISRRLTSRLSRLETTASRVAAVVGTDTPHAPLGELQVAGPIEGHDEVASLTSSFNAMMVALDERMAANANLYAAAQERVRDLTGLAEIARLLTAGPSVQETMDILGAHVCRLVGCSAVAIWLSDGEAGTDLYGGHGLPREYEALTDEVLDELSDDDFETTARKAVRTGEVAYCRLIDEQTQDLPPKHGALRRAMRSLDLSAATAVPLRVQDHMVGAMTCYTVSPEPLSGSDLSLLTTIADQVAVAVENARLYERSRDLAALEERQRLARELHDSVSQALYGIALGAKTARSLLDTAPERAAEPMEYVLSLAEAGLTEMRALIFELRPEALETEGLVPVLARQVAAIQARHGLEVQTMVCTEPDVPFAVKEAAYRIAQEALNNAVKHAHASHVNIGMDWNRDGIVLEIGDDGKGFDPEAVFVGHLGLRTMRERAVRLGGTLEVKSRPGEGTRIRTWIPRIVPDRAVI